MTNYLALNRANWDDRAAAHAASPDYAVAELVDGTRRLSDVVEFDLPRLGDVGGLNGVHLQCHIGTDTLSLARLGARMTGVDLSPASLREARSIADRAGATIDYVESDVYDAPAALSGRTFDLVYTGIGALCWLPSVDRWAASVASLLRPGGRLFIREGHPMLWALTDEKPGPTVEYSYFEQPDGLVWDEGGTYVETDYEFTANTTVEWNHGLGEIVTALLDHGLALTALAEHDSVPWCALPGQMSVDERGEWRLTDRPERLPASYTLQATKT
ncbi:class I SAM-dependent methyltransferase [Flexivirga meconopsidis]|uniref:class I SAM-dependent methyltransferase n=1 Tax=Flexivirga meconopsidis TaxID=2977121 RepID=UPI00223F1DE4